MSLSPAVLVELRAEVEQFQEAINVLQAVLDRYSGNPAVQAATKELTKTRKEQEKIPCPESDCTERHHPHGMPAHIAKHKRNAAKEAADKRVYKKKKPMPGNGRRHKPIPQPEPVEIAKTTCPSCQLKTTWNPCEHCKTKIAHYRIGEVTYVNEKEI